MTRTSKALKRLGVVGLTVATIGAGVPAFFATAAQAAVPPTSLSISPPSQTGTAGTCLNYTVTAQDASSQPSAGATITVTLTPTAGSPSTQDVDFCTATNGTSSPSPTAPTNVTNGGVGANDQGTFITDSTGKFTFGIISNQPGGPANIQAFYDVNGNGAFNAGEPQSQATANFVGGGAPGSNAQADVVRCVDATPESATNVVGETHTFQVVLTNNSPTPLTGAPGPNVPNSGNSTCPGNVVPGVAPSFTVTGSVSGTNLGPITCGQSDNTGTATCSYTRSAVGTDTINVYVNQSAGGTGGQDPGEPGDTITKNWIAAQTGNTIAVTCANDPGGAGSGTGVSDVNGSGANSAGGAATCTNRNTDPDRVFTATVKTSGTTPTLVSGALVRFTVTTGDGTLNGSTTSKTFDCTTDGTGTCSVLLTDADPISGEKQTVTAVIRGTSSSGSATLTFTNVPGDARNVTLTPKTQTVTPGSGVGSLTALVTDVDGAPVPNVLVTFTESGPGRFVNTAGTTFQEATDANGKATVEVSALSSESGTETITADISQGGANACAAAAGKDAGGSALPTRQAAARAGNCTDTATVTYGAASPSPSSPAPGGRGTLTTSTPDIQPNITAILNATGLTPNAVYELMCYSRPSTTYFAARTVSTSASETTKEFRLLPGTNTRCYVRPQGNDSLASNSVVINVHTTLSLSAVRTGVRTYVFQGRNLPRRSGQLITLYRIVNGQEIRTSNLVTDASGIYRVTRKFTGTGTFQFRVRTSQNLTNAAGASNIITVTVH